MLCRVALGTQMVKPGDWEERQWRRTQLSELRRGREVDIQTDGKWEEKVPGTKLKPEEGASEMK